MIPIDTYKDNIISLENARLFLSLGGYKRFEDIDNTDKLNLLKRLLESPIEEFTEINDLYFRTKWAELVNKIYGKKPIIMLEVASGDADMIPQALARSNPSSIYITANMNKRLNESLLKKTKNLGLDIKLIDDDASMINNYIKQSSVDMIAFQHGVNDVLQAILCEQNGIDTVNTDWMECLPKMIELVKFEVENNTFEDNVKHVFLKLIKDLLITLKEGGVIAINHYMFKYDLDLGYPKELFENLIPLIRDWFKELDICQEIFYDGFSEQWWIFLKKVI